MVLIRNRWFIVFIAFMGILINYMDRSAISYAIKPIQEAFHLNNTDFGLIASAFGLGYAALVIVTGHLIDKLGSRRIWSWGAGVWSIFMILLGFATGFWWMYICRLLLGAAETACFPSFTKVIAEQLPSTERARALAVGLAAVPFASVIGSPLITYLIINFGWRSAFYILGLIGLVWGVLWYVLYRDKTIVTSTHTDINAKINTTPWKEILFNPVLITTNYAFFSFGYLLYFAITWLPGYFEQTYGINLKQIGWFLVAPWLLATILILLCGWWSDHLWRKYNSLRIARSYLIAGSQILAALCFIPVVMVHSPMIAIIFISFGIGFGMMPNAAFYALHVDLVPSRPATSLAIMVFSFGFAGMLATGLTGWLTTLTGSFNSAIWLMIGFTFSSALGIMCCRSVKE
jgi:MFS family permease